MAAADSYRHVRSLASLSLALEMMQCEMCSSLRPLPEMCREIAARVPFPADRLMREIADMSDQIGERRFSDIWTEAVRSTPELQLKPDESAVLVELGAGLGRYGLEEEESRLRGYAARIAAAWERAETEHRTNVRLYLSGGAAAGAVMALLLI